VGSECGHGSVNRFLPHTADRNARPGIEKMLRDGLSYAARAACDDGCPVFEEIIQHGHILSLDSS
jgi:hypothetical protein